MKWESEIGEKFKNWESKNLSGRGVFPVMQCGLHCVLPVVTRFFSPPEIPLTNSSPTIVSAQTSSPKICNILKREHRL